MKSNEEIIYYCEELIKFGENYHEHKHPDWFEGFIDGLKDVRDFILGVEYDAYGVVIPKEAIG